MELLTLTIILLCMAETYHMNIDKYLGLGYIPNEYNGELFVHNLKKDNHEWNFTLLEKIAEIFGVSVDDFFESNEDVLYRYFYKYADFFENYNEYLEIIKGLRDDASFSTEVIISFEKVETIIYGFNVLIARYKELFVRCVEEELKPEEIMEMNFLAYFLEIKDVYISDRVLKYDTVRCRRELYADEMSKYDWQSIFISHRLLAFAPWNCIEFANNIIAQTMLNEINVNWLNSLKIWLKEFEKGTTVFISGDNDFKIEIQYNKVFYKYNPLDEIADKNEKLVIDWFDSLYKMLEFWDNDDNTTFADDVYIGSDMSDRLENRKPFIEI